MIGSASMATESLMRTCKRRFEHVVVKVELRKFLLAL
jgi:hypothetical protein